MKTDAGVSSNQRSRARAMRGAPTDSELRLWRLLRDRRLSGFKFRRQVPVGPYIVDFLCVGAKLIVEADGSQHADSLRDTSPRRLSGKPRLESPSVLEQRGVAESRRGSGDNFRACKQTLIRPFGPPSPRGRRGAEWRLSSRGRGAPNGAAGSPSPSGRRWRAEGATDEGYAK